MWKVDELNKIGKAEELQIAGFREDGNLYRPVIIWGVRIGDDIYVRSYRGRESGWFKGVLVRHEGRIWADGVEVDVRFVEESNNEINNQIDSAYRTKYGHYPQYVASMCASDVRATTLKLVPR